MSPVEFAHTNGRAHIASVSRSSQKAFGQFMTPPAIAHFMARRLVADIGSPGHVRILEPAAGAGILAAAAVEELLAREDRPQLIELMMCELDDALVPMLNALGDRLAQACKARNVTLDWHVHAGDFLTSELARSGEPIENLLVIANPPYSKLSGRDPRAAAHRYAVYGQPNIYGLFMAACARLVGASGRYCFITPRSWMSGNYFLAVRRVLFHHLRIDAWHMFESRTGHFEEDAVLQEAAITWATGRAAIEQDSPVVVSRSEGASDLDTAQVQSLSLARLVAADHDQMVSLPGAREDSFENWPARLDTLGLKVSTGKVIAFRQKANLRTVAADNTVPLLWLQHVRHNTIHWPIRKKSEHMVASAETAWTLVPHEPIVVLRRFSPKEDIRRVTAAAYLGDLPGAALGLENHLNYIYRPGGSMTADEAKGIAAYLNSRIVDGYFRAIAGSTQVNAAELRKLPFPPLEVLISAGRQLPADPTLAQADEVIERAIGQATGSDVGYLVDAQRQAGASPRNAPG